MVRKGEQNIFIIVVQCVHAWLDCGLSLRVHKHGCLTPVLLVISTGMPTWPTEEGRGMMNSSTSSPLCTKNLLQLSLPLGQAYVRPAARTRSVLSCSVGIIGVQ